MDQYQGYAYWWRITGSAGGLRSTEPPPSQWKARPAKHESLHCMGWKLSRLVCGVVCVAGVLVWFAFLKLPEFLHNYLQAYSSTD